MNKTFDYSTWVTGSAVVDYEKERKKLVNELLKTEGVKNDSDKLRTDLLPVDAVEAVTGVLTFGASKYADRNWEKGMSWSRCYGAALRHLFAFWRGENNDPESGRSHLAHAMCCVMFLLSYQLRNIGKDDRP